MSVDLTVLSYLYELKDLLEKMDSCPHCQRSDFCSKSSLKRHSDGCSEISAPPRKSSRKTNNLNPIYLTQHSEIENLLSSACLFTK